MCDLTTLPPESGIYQITCSETNKIYVGSSKNIRKRLQQHFSSLEQGKHANVYLQRAFDTYGLNAFTAEVLELCSVEDLLPREQHYMDKSACYDSKVGYNLCKVAGKVTYTPEVIEKIRKAQLNRVKTPEEIEKIRLKNKGRKLQGVALQNVLKGIETLRGIPRSQETRRKVSESKKANPYTYTDDVKQKMKDRYAENREYRLSLLEEARKNKRPLTREEMEKVRLGSLKQAMSRKTCSDLDVLNYIKYIKEYGYIGPRVYAATTAIPAEPLYEAFKGPIRSVGVVYLPIADRIGFLDAGGTSVTDLRNPNILDKLSLDIEVSEESPNLFTNVNDLSTEISRIKQKHSS